MSSKFQKPYLTYPILLFCKIGGSTSPYALHEWASSCSTKMNFLGYPRHECIFQVCPNFCPKVPYYLFLVFFSSRKLLGLSLSFSLPSLSLSLSLFFCWLDGSLELVGSLFKIQTAPKLKFWTFERKLKGFDFKFHFFKIHFCEWCEFEAIIMGWKYIHEDSWNLKMK